MLINSPQLKINDSVINQTKSSTKAQTNNVPNSTVNIIPQYQRSSVAESRAHATQKTLPLHQIIQQPLDNTSKTQAKIRKPPSKKANI